MRSTAALQKVRSLVSSSRSLVRKQKNKCITTALKSQTRCLSSARPLPTEEEEVAAVDWQDVKSMRIAPQTPSIGTTTTAPAGSTSSAAATELSTNYLLPLVTDFLENIDSYAPTSNELTYTGDITMPLTTRLHIVTPQEDTPRGTWPVFRLMDENGHFRDPALDGKEGQRSLSAPATRSSDDYSLDELRTNLAHEYPYHEQEFQQSGLLEPALHPFADTQSKNTLLRAHRQVVRLREMDSTMLNAQRQGRISFYMACRGEEAIHMGAASALEVGDPIFAQYREQGLLMWRGFTLEQFTNSCFSNDADMGKGRQMPVHYGSRALNYHTISSPLGTQLPQAVGAGYRLKLAGKKNVPVCFFGDGCASTTDFHSALNFAATLKAPVIFLCRNNGYAISTPVTDQYAGDGVVSRAPGYGMAGIRIDGNDIFAVHAAVREAKAYALENNAPVLIEAMTYRMGHHSTSDDSSRYRSPKEVQDFEDRYDPLTRLEKFLKHQDWLSEEQAATIKDEELISVRRALEQAERRPEPPLESLFEDVYHEMPRHLQEQQAQLREHIAKYPKRY